MRSVTGSGNMWSGFIGSSDRSKSSCWFWGRLGGGWTTLCAEDQAAQIGESVDVPPTIARCDGDAFDSQLPHDLSDPDRVAVDHVSGPLDRRQVGGDLLLGEPDGGSARHLRLEALQLGPTLLQPVTDGLALLDGIRQPGD